MSLSIMVYKDEENSKSINWLRNPFGLGQWAEAVMRETNPEYSETSFWHVTNTWSYDNSKKIDRPLFLKVVKKYAETINCQQKGFFYFNVSEYIYFVEPYLLHLPISNGGIKGGEYIEAGKILKIPMELFSHKCFNLGGNHTLQSYKDWFGEIVEIAELLQNEEFKFYCSR